MNYDKNKEIYTNLSQRIRALSVSFKSALDDKVIRIMFNEQMELREKISDIFHKYCGEICSQCRGDCCRSYIRLRKKDLLLFIAQNGLVLPDLDWDFINSQNYCIFLSGSGCILKEFRPWQCLKHVCNEFSLNAKILKEIGSLINEYELNINRCAGEIQRRWHLTLD